MYRRPWTEYALAAPAPQLGAPVVVGVTIRLPSPFLQTKGPRLRAFLKRMKELEPSTFCMATRPGC